MLFLGNEKFPQESDYQNFVQSHGGSTNAYTTFEHTNYYFEVASDSLEPTLDRYHINSLIQFRFAQFFICPTFTESATSREMHAVHSGIVDNMFLTFLRIRKEQDSRRLALGESIILLFLTKYVESFLPISSKSRARKSLIIQRSYRSQLIQ